MSLTVNFICRAKDSQLIMSWIKYCNSHLGGLFLSTDRSRHIFQFISRFGWKLKEGRTSEGKLLLKTKKKWKNERKCISFVHHHRALSGSAELWVFLCLSRTCLHTQHSEGCWLTANSNYPEAKGSHLQTGPFIFPWKRKWSLAMILNHPTAAVLQGHQGSPLKNTSAYLHVWEGTVMWSAIETEGQVRWADKRWTEHSLGKRRKRNTRFRVLSDGSRYSLPLQSGSEEFMWLLRWAALKGVTKEMAQGRWERTREGGRGWEEEESPGTEEEGKSIHFSPGGEVWRVRAVLLLRL